MTALEEQLKHALNTRHPVVYLHTPEEQRVIDALGQVAGDTPVVTWSCTTGLDGDDTRDPVAAIQSIMKEAKPGFYVFKDLPAFFDDVSVVRVLRDAYYRFNELPDARLFIVSPVLTLPESLRANLYVVDIVLPVPDELVQLVNDTMSEYTRQEIPAEVLRNVALSLRGMTLDDARHIMHGVLAGAGKLSKSALLDEIRDAKKAFTAGAGFLEYVPIGHDVTRVGGLSNFKSWLDDRSTVFNQQAVEANLPIPRGILIMGVSGCGKSLCAKTVAKTWNVPLYRLDMNLVFSQIYGNPEETFHKAMRTIESMAPAVLWIDEIENGLGFTDQASAEQSHIFSAFLTWMQEKPPLIFVAATANRIEYLPAEMIRKGRFDQVFFVDLPDAKERAELFEIHLGINGLVPENFDMKTLVGETGGWNGAEIEQLVHAVRIHGHRHNSVATTEDFVELAKHIVPLSQTMYEQIKKQRDWAWDRATPASSGKGTDVDVIEEGVSEKAKGS